VAVNRRQLSNGLSDVVQMNNKLSIFSPLNGILMDFGATVSPVMFKLKDNLLKSSLRTPYKVVTI